MGEGRWQGTAPTGQRGTEVERAGSDEPLAPPRWETRAGAQPHHEGVA